MDHSDKTFMTFVNPGAGPTLIQQTADQEIQFKTMQT